MLLSLKWKYLFYLCSRAQKILTLFGIDILLSIVSYKVANICVCIKIKKKKNRKNKEKHVNEINQFCLGRYLFFFEYRLLVSHYYIIITNRYRT